MQYKYIYHETLSSDSLLIILVLRLPKPKIETELLHESLQGAEFIYLNTCEGVRQ